MFFMVLDTFATDYTGQPPPAVVILLLNYDTKIRKICETTKHFRHFFRKNSLFFDSCGLAV